jgi:transposase-like protein
MAEKQPETLREAVVYFSDSDRAFEFAKSLRWTDGQPVCPRCGCLEHSFLSTRRVWKCKGCKRQFSVKVGTIFEDSPIGFEKWLPCVWLIANSKNSISSYEVARSIGVTQKTAWFMLHRIREAIGRQDDETVLSGTIEMDETYVDALADNMHKWTRERRITARGNKGKTAVQGMGRHDGGVVRAEVVSSLSERQTQVAIRGNVAPGAAIYSDESILYRRVGHSFARKTVNPQLSTCPTTRGRTGSRTSGRS